MADDRFRGAWRRLKGNLKREWGKLTDDDLMQIDGNMDLLIGKLQQRYGYSKEQAERDYEEWIRTQRRDYIDLHGAGGGPDEGAQFDTDTHGPGGGPDSC